MIRYLGMLDCINHKPLTDMMKHRNYLVLMFQMGMTTRIVVDI